jgi:hypothetical protein
MGSRQVEIVTNEVHQKLPRFDGDGPADTIDRDRHRMKLFIGIEHSNLHSED